MSEYKLKAPDGWRILEPDEIRTSGDLYVDIDNRIEQIKYEGSPAYSGSVLVYGYDFIVIRRHPDSAVAYSAWKDIERIGHELQMDQEDITPDNIVNNIAGLNSKVRCLTRQLEEVREALHIDSKQNMVSEITKMIFDMLKLSTENIEARRKIDALQGDLEKERKKAEENKKGWDNASLVAYRLKKEKKQAEANLQTVQDERAESFLRLKKAIGKVGMTEYQPEIDIEIEARINQVVHEREQLQKLLESPDLFKVVKANKTLREWYTEITKNEV